MSEELDPRVRPEFAKGRLVPVGWARNQAEAEMMAGLLLEQGIPSLVRRTGGADVPDFLAAGPRELLVPSTGAALARELLGTPEPVEPGEGSQAWMKALAVAVAVAVVALVAAGVFAAVF